MNILILNWRDPLNPQSGGAEIVTSKYAQAWAKKGHSVIWLSQSFPKAKSEEDFGSIQIIRKGNIITFVLFAWLYYISHAGIDLVFDEVHGIPYFTPLYVKKAKIVVFIHEVAGDIWDYMYPVPLNFVGKLLERWFFVVYKNRTFITVSDSTEEELGKKGIRNVFIIQNGLSIPKHISKVRKEKDPTFVFVSRIVKMKGIEQVLQAFEYILKITPRAKLWVIGSGSETYIASLKRHIPSFVSMRVEFFGRLSEREKFNRLQRAHILLHASVKEGWGLVVSEAASQGTPSVVYNVAGLRDSVKDGKTGIVLRINTPEEMSKEALALYNNKNKYKKFQKHAIFFAKSLQWKNAEEKSLEIIESI